MATIKIDSGSIMLITFIIILTVFAILYPKSTRNSLFGIRVKKVFESEEIWHKVHVTASFVTIPFILLLIACLFVEGELTKIFLGFIIMVLLIIAYLIIPEFVSKKYFQEKKLQEDQELAEQIKKETGWR